MTIFGLIATVVICGTVGGCVFWLTKKPISVKIIRSNEIQYTSEPRFEKETAPTKSEELVQNNKTEVVNMDAVIREMNTLMGIQTIEEDNNGGQ